MTSEPIILSLILFLLGQFVEAGSRIEVVGASKTHLAIRLLKGNSGCCGEKPEVNCQYPGLKLIGLKTRTLKHPTDPNYFETPFEPRSVDLVFVPFKRDSWIKVEDGELPRGAKKFEIYKGVQNKKDCTKSERSKQLLAEAKSHAKVLGIDLDSIDLETEAITRDYFDPTLCAKKTSSDCLNKYFKVIVSSDPDDLGSGRIEWRLFKVSDQAEFGGSATSGTLFLPLQVYRSKTNGIEIYDLSHVTTGTSSGWMTTHLIVHELSAQDLF